MQFHRVDLLSDKVSRSLHPRDEFLTRPHSTRSRKNPAEFHDVRLRRDAHLSLCALFSVKENASGKQ